MVGFIDQYELTVNEYEVRVFNQINGKVKILTHDHKILLTYIIPYDYILVTNCDNTLRFWDLHTGECIRILTAIGTCLRLENQDNHLMAVMMSWDMTTYESVYIIDSQ